MSEAGHVTLPSSLVDAMLDHVLARHPDKSFGYLTAPIGQSRPSAFIAFEDNIRNDEQWRPAFEARGRYFVDHPDAGFVATEAESLRVHRRLVERDQHEVALFHTHRRHPGNFSEIDYDLHISRFPRMWHLVISLRNARLPQLRAFSVSRTGVRELRVRVTRVRAATQRRDPPGDWRQVLALDRRGLPTRRDAATVLRTIAGLTDRDQYAEHVTAGLLRHAEQRHHDHVAPHLATIGASSFAMGTDPAGARHFCGETPRHRVTLSPYRVSRFAVTNRLYALFDPDRAYGRAEADLPVTGVSWFDAALCAAWFGCRLPTEAEWEFACGAGSAGEWSVEERELPRHAWYSDNADRRRHPVGDREPNPVGLHDLHGNVWEWCQDRYFPGYYAASPPVDPVAEGGLAGRHHRVARGGGYLALAEMCRTRFRLHDPAEYAAVDLGFRLAGNA